MGSPFNMYLPKINQIITFILYTYSPYLGHHQDLWQTRVHLRFSSLPDWKTLSKYNLQKIHTITLVAQQNNSQIPYSMPNCFHLRFLFRIFLPEFVPRIGCHFLIFSSNPFQIINISLFLVYFSNGFPICFRFPFPDLFLESLSCPLLLVLPGAISGQRDNSFRTDRERTDVQRNLRALKYLAQIKQGCLTAPSLFHSQNPSQTTRQRLVSWLLYSLELFNTRYIHTKH